MSGKDQETGRTDNVSQARVARHGLAVVALPALKALGEVDDLLAVRPELVQGLHRALGNHWVCSHGPGPRRQLSGLARRTSREGERREGDGLGLHLPWQTVSSIFSTSTWAFAIVWQNSASTVPPPSLVSLAPSSKGGERGRGRTEHLVGLAEAERQAVRLHQALVRLGALLAHGRARGGGELVE